MRALAALLVLVDHWRNIFFVDYPDLLAHRLLYALPYLLSSAGHQSVVIFFVLSGYLISGSIFRSISEILYAFVLARLTEFRTDRLRQTLERNIPWLRPEPLQSTLLHVK